MLIISVSTTAWVYAPRSASNSQAAGRLWAACLFCGMHVVISWWMRVAETTDGVSTQMHVQNAVPLGHTHFHFIIKWKETGFYTANGYVQIEFFRLSCASSRGFCSWRCRLHTGRQEGTWEVRSAHSRLFHSLPGKQPSLGKAGVIALQTSLPPDKSSCISFQPVGGGSWQEEARVTIWWLWIQVTPGNTASAHGTQERLTHASEKQYPPNPIMTNPFKPSAKLPLSRPSSQPPQQPACSHQRCLLGLLSIHFRAMSLVPGLGHLGTG